MADPFALPLIVFDLDGTLVESAPDLIGSLNFILDKEGLPGLPLDEGRAYVGRGAKIMLQRGFAASGRELSGTRLDQLFAAFLAYYEEHLADQTCFYPGALDALDTLAAAGHAFAICTNKLEILSKKLIAALGATHRFRVIAGQDTFPVSKPNGATLKLTIEKAGGDPCRAILVGDSETDLATAKDAGLPVVAVDFGYCQVPIESLEPDQVISHFRDLPAAIERVAGLLPA